MDDLRRQSADITRLANLAPSPRRRAVVAAALDSKWEGIQSAGLKVLGAWGGRGSIGRLKSFLQDAFQREAGWSIRGVAIRNLAPLLDGSDAEWVLQLYFSLPTLTAKHEILPLVLQLPAAAARRRLVAELRNQD
jgi:hypothetical protein